MSEPNRVRKRPDTNSNPMHLQVGASQRGARGKPQKHCNQRGDSCCLAPSPEQPSCAPELTKLAADRYRTLNLAHDSSQQILWPTLVSCAYIPTRIDQPTCYATRSFRNERSKP